MKKQQKNKNNLNSEKIYNLNIKKNKFNNL